MFSEEKCSNKSCKMRSTCYHYLMIANIEAYNLNKDNEPECPNYLEIDDSDIINSVKMVDMKYE